MASLTEILGAQDNPQPFSGVGDAIKQGIGLAQAKQQMELQQVEVSAQKEKLAQQQMNGVVNRLKAAAFAPKSQQETLLKNTEMYGNQIGVPLDINGFRDVLKDETTAIAFKKGLYDLQNGKMPPQEFFSIAASAPDLFKAVNDQAYQNSQSINKYESALDLAQEKAKYKAEIDQTKRDAALEKVKYGMGKDVAEAVNKGKADFDRSVKDDLEAISQSSKAESLLMSGGTIAGEAAKSTVARMFEKGVLTDADVGRLSGGRGLLDQGERLVKKMYSGELTDEDRNQLLKITQTLKPVLEEKVRKRAEREAIAKEKAYKTMGITRQQFSDAYAVDELLGAAPNASQEQPNAATATPPVVTKKPAADIVKQFSGKKSPEVIKSSLKKLGYSDQEISSAFGGK